MAQRKRCGRFAGMALAGGPLAVAGFLSVAPAQADANSYLNDAHSAGIQDAQGGDEGLLAAGQRICQQLWAGANAADLKAKALERSDAAEGSKGLDPQQASALVDIAFADLCPE
jgi:cell division septum initiation protein DivIVA